MNNLTILLTLSIAVSSALSTDEPCPVGCRCSSKAAYDRHRWHRLLAAYRTRKLVYGNHGAGGVTAWRPRRNYEHTGGREMTCLGLSTMPDYIPTDVSKLTLYGDSKSRTPHTDRLGDQSATYDGHRNANGHPTSARKYNQLTAISKYSFRSARGISEVSIEGNRIKVIHPNEFDMLSGMKTLMLRDNRLKLIWKKAFKGLEKLEELDLSKNHIKRLSKTVLLDVPNVKKLYLNKNRIRGLHTKLFRKLKKMEVLDVSDNFLKAMHGNLFVNNPNMKVLIADNNNIMHIKPEWFLHMRQLTKLSLKGNRIYEIQSNVFQPLSFLKSLHLDKNEITVIEKDALANIQNLHSLSLSQNNISVITPGAFQDTENLKVLDLSQNKIEKMENGTFMGLVTLDSLSLSNNKLLGIGQPVFGHIKKLTHLDLSNNDIKIIKTMNFYGLLELRELKLENNQIKVIEEEGFAVSLVNSYSKLTWLYLQYNQLSTVTSRMLYGLAYLKFLNLCHNEIMEIEDGGLSMVGRLHSLVMNNNQINHMDFGLFKHLRHLRHLNLASNDLHDLAYNIFLGLDNVEDINLQNNPIRDVPVETFQDTPRLANLNLKKNKLRRFDLEILEHTNKLKYLDLSRNGISKIHMPKQFKGGLYFLSLADNHIENLPAEITKTLTRGGSLHLYGNPWSCDCDLGWIRDVYLGDRYKLPEHDEIACKSPRYLAGEQVLSLRPEYLQCDLQDEPLESEPPPASSTAGCSFMGHAKGTHSRRNLRQRKWDLLNWHATLLTTNETFFCSGILLSQDWILTPSSCWKFYQEDQHILLRIGQQSEENIAREVTIDEIEYYPGSLDIALIKILPVQEGISQRVFPCVLTEDGATEIISKKMHGILDGVKIHPRHEDRVKIKPLIYETIGSSNLNGVKGLIVKGSVIRMREEGETIVGEPFFVKVGISKWAFVGFKKKSPGLKQKDETLVSIMSPSIGWINTLIHQH